MKEPVFEVFARKSREDPLAHVGYVNAPDVALARVYAWHTYDEQNWFEMCVIPREAIVPVNLTESTFAAKIPLAAGTVLHAPGAASYGGSDLAAEEVPS